jgi:hypothetical protein
MDFNLWATASLQSRQPSDIIISALSGLDEVAATDPPIPMKKSGRKKRAQVSQPGASSSPDLTPSDSENMIDAEAEPSAILSDGWRGGEGGYYVQYSSTLK